MAAFIQLKLNKVYTFKGTQAQLEYQIQAVKGPIRAVSRSGRYRLYATSSFGTLRSNVRALSSRIYVDATIIPINDNLQELRLTTNVRPEHYFIAFTGVFMVTTMFRQEGLKIALLITGMVMICFLWFHMIFRAQENEVVKCIEAQLDLVK